MEVNSHAGQGAVLLDVGGDVGALIVTMPAEMDGVEVEIRPVGAGHSHHHEDTDQHQDHAHDTGHPHWPHVAVVRRPLGDRLIPSLVFADVHEGDYELYVRPAEPVQLTVTVAGGAVTEASWPGA